MADHLPPPDRTETRGEIVRRLLTQQGGYVLMVGGKIDEAVPKELAEHPQILIWDPVQTNGLERREVPRNTRAVLYNRWVDHAITRHVISEAKKLGSVIFQMMDSRSMRELLLQIFVAAAPAAPVSEPQMTQELTVTEAENQEVLTQRETPPTTREPTGEETEAEATPPTEGEAMPPLRKPKLGEIPGFLAKHLILNRANVDEAKRLMPLLRAAGLKQTLPGLQSHISNYKKTLGQPKSNSPAAQAVARALAAAGQSVATAAAAASPVVSKSVEKRLAASAPTAPAGETTLGEFDFVQVEQLFKNAIQMLRNVMPAIEKAMEVLPALELVLGELPKVKREVETLKKIREAMR